MSLAAKCPRCGKIQTVADSDAGQSILCSACGARFNHTLPPAASPVQATPLPLPAPVVQAPPPLLTASHLWIYLSAAVSLFSILLISFVVLEKANQPGTPPPAIMLPAIAHAPTP